MIFYSIDTHTEDDGVQGVILRDVTLEAVSLKRAALGLVLWIEVGDDPLTLLVCEADRPVLLRGQGESWVLQPGLCLLPLLHGPSGRNRTLLLYAPAHHWYAWYLALLGRKDDALAEMRKAANLDPLSLNINSDLAEFLLIARFPDESIPQSRKTIDMDPAFPAAHNQLAQRYLAKHLYTEAIAELQKSIQLSGDSPIFTANLVRAYGATNRKAEAVELLNDLKGARFLAIRSSGNCHGLYGPGRQDQAITWLEKRL